MIKRNEYYKEFIMLGYSEDEADALATLAIKQSAEIPELNPELELKIIETLNSIGCTSFRMSPEELREIYEN